MSQPSLGSGIATHDSDCPCPLPRQVKSQGLTLNKVVIDVGKKEFSQASHLWPVLKFISSKTVHMCQSVCVHVGLGACGLLPDSLEPCMHVIS